MNKFQKLAIGFAVIAATLASAVAAPSATRHTKLLSIKQRVMINSGESRTSASLVSPTAHSRAGIVLLTNTFAAVPLPANEVAKFQAAAIQRFPYETFWSAMNQLQTCENDLSNNADAYTYPTYGGVSDGEFNSYIYQQPPVATKIYANQIIANYPSPAGSIPPQYQSPTGIPASCTNGGNPAAYAAAAAVRASVGNYTLDSPEALDYVTSQFWIKSSGAANSLKAAVVKYLRENEIDYAWVDVEFEYEHKSAEPSARRISMSFQINRSDGPTTRGSYIGSQVVLSPDVTPAQSSVTVRTNNIDIKYSAYSQYPDFTIKNPDNLTYLKGLMSSKGLNDNGVLSWKIQQNGASAISPRICQGISDCTLTEGKFKTTSGAYDPDFARAGFGQIPNAPYTLEHPGPITDISGIKCLVKGIGSTQCRVDKHNVSTLMQYSNAIKGTLDYIGRWEVDFTVQPPTFEEQGRAGVFDVCHGVELQNTITTNYWVKRPRWKLNLFWDAGTVAYDFAEPPKYEFENIAQLPKPVTYTTYPMARNNYNLVGNEVSPDNRANNAPSTPTNAQYPNNYAAVNLVAYDPQTFGLPDREGAMMVNPFVSSVSSAGILFNSLPNNWILYRPIGTYSEEETVAARMRPLSNKYKAADVTQISNSLPRLWLQRGNNPQVRTADFNCKDQNEPAYYALYNRQMAPPPGAAGYSPPPDPIIPSGDTPYSGTVSGHKTGTRGSVGSPGDVGTGVTSDPCQLSYVLWSTITYRFPRAGPLPDPAFVAPPACSAPPPAVPPTSGCSAPLNWYTVSVETSQPVDLTFINVNEKACEERCEIGGTVNRCTRPYQRFN